MIVGCMGMVCRMKKFYKKEVVDFGDYGHVVFGKVKRVEDLFE